MCAADAGSRQEETTTATAADDEHATTTCTTVAITTTTQQQLLLAARKLLLPWLLPLFAGAVAAASVAQDSMKIVERVNCKCSTSFIAQGKGLMCPLNLTEVAAEL